MGGDISDARQIKQHPFFGDVKWEDVLDKKVSVDNGFLMAWGYVTWCNVHTTCFAVHIFNKAFINFMFPEFYPHFIATILWLGSFDLSG